MSSLTSTLAYQLYTVRLYTFIGYDEHEDDVGAGQETATQFMFLSPQDMRYEMCCRIRDHVSNNQYSLHLVVFQSEMFKPGWPQLDISCTCVCLTPQ